VTDLERFFRQIVRNLAATDPARLDRPLPLMEIRDHIVPYRTNRRALELESSEDYELILMRLCAGEGGFARTEPDEVRAEFEAEVKGSNPDLAMVHRHENAVVCLETGAVARALDPKPELAFAPPDHPDHLHRAGSFPSVPGSPHPTAHDSSLPTREERDAAPRCTGCNGALPAERTINFCPHCGQSQLLTRCPVCDSELEAGWRHCASCGYLIGAD
jgi:predicted RNA-binding Zn-ribbon protein involved in translation (DUF1610 family)